MTFHPMRLWRKRHNPNVGLTARQKAREQKYWQIINSGCAIYVSRYSTAIYESRYSTAIYESRYSTGASYSAGNVTFHPVRLWRKRHNFYVGLTARLTARERKC